MKMKKKRIERERWLNGGGREGGGVGGIWSVETELGVRWPCLSMSTICCQIARHASKARDSVHTHSKPYMSFNMYVDGQAVTQKAPKGAWSG